VGSGGGWRGLSERVRTRIRGWPSRERFALLRGSCASIREIVREDWRFSGTAATITMIEEIRSNGNNDRQRHGVWEKEKISEFIGREQACLCAILLWFTQGSVAKRPLIHMSKCASTDANLRHTKLRWSPCCGAGVGTVTAVRAPGR
jgi:hypothetical protein